MKNSKYFLFLLVLFTSPIQGQTCTGNTFPYIFGGTGGDTQITAMDANSAGEFLIGGDSSDSSISNGGPFLALFASDGTLSWANRYSSPSFTKRIIDCKFVGSDKVAQVFHSEGDRLRSGIFQKSNGRTLYLKQSSQTSSFSFENGAMLIHDGTSITLVGSNSGKWVIIDFNGAATGVSAQIRYNNGDGHAYNAVHSPSANAFYVGGWLEDSNGDFFDMLMRLDSNMNYGWSMVRDFGGNSAHGYIRYLYLDPSTETDLYSCGEINSNKGEIVFSRFQLTGGGFAYSSFVSYAWSDGGKVDCGGVYGSGTRMHSVVHNEDSHYFYFLSLDLSTGQLTESRLEAITGDSNSFIGNAKILSATEAYYAGQLEYVRYGQSNEISYSTKVGYIMSISDTNTCVSHTNTNSGPSGTSSRTNWSYSTSFGGSSPGYSTSSHAISGTQINLGFDTSPSSFCQVQPVLTASTLTDQTFTVGDTALSYTPSEFSFGPSCTGGSITYTVRDSSQNPFSADLLQFNTASFTFTIDTGNEYVGQHLVEIYATAPVNGDPQTATATFTLTVTNNCPSGATISSSTISAEHFTVGTSAAINKNLGTFVTISNPNCEGVYTLTNFDGSPIDAGIFTFDDATQILTIDTSDVNDEGDYQLTFTAEFINEIGTVQTTSQSFFAYIDIPDLCASSTITTTSLTSYTYDISDSAQTLDSIIWTQTEPTCTTDIDYTIQLSDGSAFSPTFLTIPAAGGNLDIDTSLIGDVNTYNLEIYATIGGNAPAEEDFVLTITNNCPTVSITKSDCGSVSYTIASPSDSCSFSEWTQAHTYCGTFTYTAQIIAPSTQALPNSFLVFDDSTKTFTYSTSNNGDAGTYTVEISGNLNGHQTVVSTFPLEILGCQTATFGLPSAMVTTVYTLESGTDTVSIPVFTSDQNEVACGVITYVAEQSIDGVSYTSLDSNIFTFTSNDPNTLDIASSDELLVDTYYIRITGTQGAYGSASFTFDVDVQASGCQLAQIIDSAFGPFQYDINEGEVNLHTLAWTITQTCATSITYDVELFGGGAIGYVYLDGNSIKIDTSDDNNVGTLNLQVVGSLGSYTSATQPFDIEITNNCITDTVTSYTPSDFVYDIGVDGSQTFDFTQWTTTLTYCGSFTYSASITSPSIASLPSSYLSFVGGTRMFTVDTSNSGDEGIYTVEVQGDLGSFYQESQTFLLTLVHCTGASLIFTNPGDQVYQLEATKVDVQILYFATDKDDQTCGSIAYSVTQDRHGDGLGSYSLDTTLFTFSDDGTDLRLSIQGTNPAHVGTYTISVKGTQGTAPPVTMFFYVTVNPAIDPCDSTLIMTNSISDVEHLIGGTTTVISFNDWVDTVGTCGSFTYTAEFANGTALNPDVFTFDGLARTLTIQTNNLVHLGTSTIEITGDLNGYGSDTVSFLVIIGCDVNYLKATYVIDQKYQIGADQVYFTFSDFTLYPNCDRDIIYIATLKDGSILPDFIHLDYPNHNFTVNTTDLAMEGNYTICIVGIVANSNDEKNTTLLVNLEVQSTPIVPFLISSPLDQELTVGETLDYPLPDVYQSSSYDKTVTVEVLLGQAESFVTYNNGIFSITPQNDTFPADYSIYILLQDEDGMTKEYEFIITVLAMEEEEEPPSVIIPIDIATITSESGSSSTTEVIQAQSTLSSQLTAQITSITQGGKILVEFSEAIMLSDSFDFMTNQTRFQEVISMIIIENNQPLSFTYELIEITENGMEIQLYFDDPYIVSQGFVSLSFQEVQEADSVEIKFVENEYFVSKKTGSTIEQEYVTNSKTLPKQMSYGKRVFFLHFRNSSDFIFNRNYSQPYPNLYESYKLCSQFSFVPRLLNKSRATSLNMLWGMINTLQIIVAMPLMNLTFPPNAQLIFSFIGQMANFNFLPQEKIAFFMDYSQNSDSFNENFELMDIFEVLSFELPQHFTL